MQVPVATLQPSIVGAMLSIPSGVMREKQAAPPESGNLALSDLSLAVLRQGWSEVHFSAQSSRFAFYRDGGLALSVQTRTSFTARHQEVMLEIRLPASLLGEGITLKSPLTIEIEAWDEHLRLQTFRQVSQVKPTRRVEEILFDILKAIQEALGGKNPKSLRLYFDEEALRILSADEKLRKLIQELLHLIQIIQALRHKELSEETLIAYISGKGKPYWQINEEQSVEIEETRVSLRLIFQPSESA